MDTTATEKGWFDSRRLTELKRIEQSEKAEREGLDDPNEFDKLKYEFEGKEYVADWGTITAADEYRSKMEREMLGRFAPVVPRGNGILDQIKQETPKTYAPLTMGLIEDTMKSLSSEEKDFTIITSRRGRKELADATRKEGERRLRETWLIEKYKELLLEYDMSEEDKKRILDDLTHEYGQLTGKSLRVAITTAEELSKDAEEPWDITRKHIMATRGLHARRPGLSMGLTHLPEFLSKPDIAGKLIQAYPSFSVTGMMDEWGKPIEGSTPVIPNLGDSPAGKDTKEGFFSRWTRKLGDSTKLLK